MKTDLATSIIAAILGVVAAYFICNLLLPSISDVTFKVLNSNFSYTVSDPNPEIFNYRAIDPTVEVYVGQCKEYDQNGNCVDIIESLEELESEIPEEPTTPEDQESPEEAPEESPDKTPEEQENGGEDENGTSD